MSKWIETPEQLCPGCMGNRGGAERCPACDWVEGTAPENPSQLLPRTILEKKYLLGRALGQGGFGITYLAWDLAMARKLAIKEFYPRELCSRAQDAITVQPNTRKGRVDFEWGLARFKEEGQNLARFRDYPGIVSLLDYFEANGTAYIVMMYVEGMTLKQYLELQPNERISFNAALAILGPVMDALREVHSVDMLHRDISPDNIYLSSDKHVKILDFGATRYAMRDQTRSMTVLFKPGYAPFEQYSSKGNQGPWSDVYAVAATFYRAICGHAPPDSPDRMNRDELMAPSAMGVALPQKSESTLLKALAIRVENRFQSMKEFQEAIMQPELIPFPPVVESGAQPSQKGKGQGFLVAKVAATVLFAILLVSGGVWWGQKPTPAPVPAERTDVIEAPAKPQKIAPPAEVEDSQLKAELQRQKEELDALRKKQERQAEAEENARIAAAKAEREAAWKRQHPPAPATIKTSQANPMIPSVPSPAGLTVVNFEIENFNRITGTHTPQQSFLSAATQRVLCSVGGPTPDGGAQAFSGDVRIVFVNPSGGIAAQALLKVRTPAGQSQWAVSAYTGKDEPGNLEKGNWRCQAFFGGQLLKEKAFTVY